MNNYNLIHESWIKVKYLNGDIKRVSLIELFRNAHLIEDIISENFKSGTFVKYEFCLYRFLSVLVMDAYNLNDKYNEDVKNDIYEEDKFDNIIEDYLLNYSDCFELFNEQHPFMQASREFMDIKSLKSSKGNVQLLNPMAIANTGRFYGIDNKLLRDDPDDFYSVDAIEFVYLLLYTNTCRIVGGAAGNSALLGSQSVIHVVLKGKTLKDTIILNTMTLKKDEKEDKPLWRWESLSEMDKRIIKGESGVIHTLSGAFYPTMMIYGDYNGSKVSVYKQNYDKEYKKRKDIIKNIWIANIEWNTLISEHDKAKKGQPLFVTSNIDETTPLWFELVGYDNDSLHTIRTAPRVLNNVPEEANIFNVIFYLTKTDSNTVFNYVKKIEQKDILFEFINDENKKIILKNFIQDYKYIVKLLSSIIIEFYREKFGENEGEKLSPSSSIKANRTIESTLKQLETHYENVINLFQESECSIKTRNLHRKDMIFTMKKIMENTIYTQKDIIPFTKCINKIEKKCYSKWFGEETDNEKN